MKKVKIDKKLLKKISELAKINYEANEEKSLLDEFGKIMNMIETIYNVDFPMKDERMIFHQVINQFASAKKYDCESEQLIEKFPQLKDGQPSVPPISDEK